MDKRSHLLRALGLVALLLLCGLSPAAAQSDDEMERIAGRTFVVAYPDTTQNTTDDRFPNPMGDTIALYIYSPVATQVTITGNGYLNTVQVQARVFTTVYLNSQSNRAANPIVVQSNTESRNVFRVEAQDLVVLYCYICTKFGAAAWTPLPLESWGLEYYVAANEQEILQDVGAGGPSDFPSRSKAAPAEACVISAYDNTTLTIVPSLRQRNDTYPDWVGFPSLTVTLAADRAYQVQGFIDTLTAHYGNPQPDIAGTYIYADKPISVLSGNTRGQLNPYENAGLARNSFKDLMIEAVAPIDQHGRQFVFTPTMDDRVLTGQPGEVTSEKRTGEIVRVYGTSLGTSIGYTDYSGSDSVRFTFENASTKDFRVGFPAGVFYRTDTPAQAYKSALSVVKNMTKIGGSGDYLSWGTYMVEMVPREQWGTFAPFIAPAFPDSMKHYVNVVTDTLSRFKIVDESNSVLTGWRNISGTDLCWTTRGVSPGVTKYFKTTDSTTRFHAFAYGLRPGSETFQPAGSSRYIERLAVSYGYPIAPRRDILRASDSLLIKTQRECDSVVIDITGINTPVPVGLRSVKVENGTNTRLELLEPLRAEDVIGKSRVKLILRGIDKFSGFRGELVIVDRTGKMTRIPFDYPPSDLLDMEPNTTNIDYGNLPVGECKDTAITFTNPTAFPVEIRGIVLDSPRVFSITAPTPAPTPTNPLVVGPGQSVQVRVRFCAREKNGFYNATLYIPLGCGARVFALHGGGTSGVEWSTVVDGTVSIHPSPAYDRAHVSLRLRHGGEVALALVDAKGAEVRNGAWELPAGPVMLPVDVAGLPNGVYYCRLTIDGVTQTFPLTVMR